MAKKIVDFLKTLITKAGGNLEDEALKEAIAKLNGDLEIEDNIATVIDNGLLSLSVAKNNYPELKNHYFGLAYKGLDDEIKRAWESENLPEEIVNELKSETSSTKRAVLLAKKIKELEGKKSRSSGAEKDELNQTITKLNNELRAEKDARTALEKQHSDNIKGVKKKYAIGQLLNKYKTIHDNLDPATKEIILNAIIDKNLKSKKADWDIDEADSLRLMGEGGANVFSEDNRLLTPQSFLDQVFASEKLLQVTDNNDNNNGNNNNSYNNNSGGNNRQYSNNNNGRNGQYSNRQQNNNGGNANNSGGKKNSVLKELLQNAQNDLQNSSGNGVM